jgi:hypothetical protein
VGERLLKTRNAVVSVNIVRASTLGIDSDWLWLDDVAVIKQNSKITKTWTKRQEARVLKARYRYVSHPYHNTKNLITDLLFSGTAAHTHLLAIFGSHRQLRLA